MSKWSVSPATGNVITYQSIGSASGITKIKAGTVDFDASDMPLKSDELARLGLGQFPLVIGALVPVVDINGIKPGQLKLTGALLADIFLGTLHKWNDPALQSLNPEIQLPDAEIRVGHHI